MMLRFGAFMAPFHALGEDPTAALRRDLDLVDWLDELGFDEVWIGEHHSGGWCPVNSPELFLAAASERTRRIRLGTGVVNLPYHHPFTVAGRAVQLDHQSRGRFMLGVGAGVTPADASMLGIAASDQRRRQEESLEAIVRLLCDDEPVTMKTDWFELNEARLHLRPYTRPCFDVAVASSGSERAMRLAGRHGIGALSFGGRPGMSEEVSLSSQWAAAEAEAGRCGTSVSRDRWRIAIGVHLADTRQEALDQARVGMGRWLREYLVGTLGSTSDLPEGREPEAAVEAGTAIIGSVEDAIEAVRRLQDESGGFGTLVVNVSDWASHEHTKHSFELIARFVVPALAGSTDRLARSQAWAAEGRQDFRAQARAAKLAAKG
jgi:limonene 1,2-monooxygenase